MTKVDEFRSLFEAAILDIAARTDADKRCIILSGGVDTCAILAAAKKVNVTFAAGFTVICGEDSPDKDFSTAAAKEYDIPHHIIRLTPDDLVSKYLPKCVQLLNTFDGMTLRNSLVIAAVFEKVAEKGFTDAIVGDGADELFGGYSFMWGMADDPMQWKTKRDKMCQQWTFATEALANGFSITSHGPYMDPKLVDWVLKTIEREDCIGARPIRLVYEGEQQDHVTGKLILREAYDTVSSWRRKDPIEVGSGVTVIGKNEYWDFKISDEEFEAEKEKLKEHGFVIASKEYLINFRVFQSCFGQKGEKYPNKKRLEIGQGCVGCCYEIGEKTFCDICGSYPAQRSAA